MRGRFAPRLWLALSLQAGLVERPAWPTAALGLGPRRRNAGASHGRVGVVEGVHAGAMKTKLLYARARRALTLCEVLGRIVLVKNLWVSRHGTRPTRRGRHIHCSSATLEFAADGHIGTRHSASPKGVASPFQCALRRIGARYPCRSPGKLRIIKHLQLNRGAAHYKCEIPASCRR